MNPRNIARVLDLGGTLTYNNTNISSNSEVTDYKALQSDWNQVGKDIVCAIKRYEEEIYAGK